MAKTVQALKVSATIDLKGDALAGIGKSVMTPSQAVTVATGRIRITKAFAARYDDPDYQARVTKRIADLKVDLAKLGDLSAWHVNAGAVPTGEAEVIPAPEADAADDE